MSDTLYAFGYVIVSEIVHCSYCTEAEVLYRPDRACTFGYRCMVLLLFYGLWAASCPQARPFVLGNFVLVFVVGIVSGAN